MYLKHMIRVHPWDEQSLSQPHETCSVRHTPGTWWCLAQLLRKPGHCISRLLKCTVKAAQAKHVHVCMNTCACNDLVDAVCMRHGRRGQKGEHVAASS